MSTLDLIIESAEDLAAILEQGRTIADREVRMLLTSFNFLTSTAPEVVASKDGRTCAALLQKLKESVPDIGKTGDTEGVRPLGFDEKGKSVVDTILKNRASAAAEKAKKKGGHKKDEKDSTKKPPGTPSAAVLSPSSKPMTSTPQSASAKPKDKTAADDGPEPLELPKTSGSFAGPSKDGGKDQDGGKKGGKKERPPAWKFVNIPAQRRMQTFVVSILNFFTGLPIFLFISVYLTITPLTMPFMVAYWIWIIFIFPRLYKHPYKPWKRWRESIIFKWYRDYFPCRLMVPREVRSKFDPKGNYMFIYHPHGVHSFGAILSFSCDVQDAHKMLPGLKFHVQTLAMNFIVPFWRELSLWGGSGDASAKCINKTLSAGPGESIVLVVGGAEESLLSDPHTNVLCLNKRKGFVKLALQNGAPLVPVFGFGETNVYYNFAHGNKGLQKLLIGMQKRFGFAFPLISGRGWFNYHWGLLPHRRPIIVVVGEPLAVPKIEKPSKEEVEHWHAQYVDALVKHYNTYKAVYDVNGTLEIQ